VECQRGSDRRGRLRGSRASVAHRIRRDRNDRTAASDDRRIARRRRDLHLTFAPDPVTGKSLPLANESYFFARGKRHVALVLSAPVGADNVDQWKKLAESLRWK